MNGTHTILVVDDEEHITTSIERLFFDEEKIRVLRSMNPLDALEVLRGKSVSLVISDNMMPEMKGIEFLSRVKAAYPDTIRILMTAYADLPTAIEAINTDEVFRFIIKPWDNEVVLGAVREGLERYEVVEKLRGADEGALLAIAQAIELKDPYTKGHCDRVASFALLLADALALTEKMKEDIRRGSWLHDCGKIGVSESILNLEGKLSESEMKVVMNHPAWGADLLRHIPVSDTVRNIVLYHHEKYGGGGYPAGLVAEKIPIEARIVAIADVYDALISDRPYRKGYPEERVVAIMRSMEGSFLDPRLLEIFISIVTGKAGEDAAEVGREG